MIAKQKKKIIIIGGGVAGLSAAHHLIGRGFDVEVYERTEKFVGGKARSIDHLTNGITLPAEHGFRFFPGFYGNITETLKQIPAGDKSVYDNLVPVSFYTFLFMDGREPINVPTTIGVDLRRFRIRKVLMAIKTFRNEVRKAKINIESDGKAFFVKRIYQLFTSCEERYLTEYERIPWSEFIEADNKAFGKDYRTLFAEGLTKNLVAVRADKASTRTGGKIFLHMLWSIIFPFHVPADRVLNAPSNQAWLNHWLLHLEKEYKRNGDSFKLIRGQRVVRLETAKASLTSAGYLDPVNKHRSKKKRAHVKRMSDSVDFITRIQYKSRAGGDVKEAQADYFISALPIEKMSRLVRANQQLLKIDPTLGNLLELYRQTEWMNGIVFYLNKKVDVCNGHITITDSDWAITLISQTQYWTDHLSQFPLPKINGCEVKSVLSVIVSNWDAEGKIYLNKKARNMTFSEVKKEVWEQLKKCKLHDADSNQHFHLEDQDCFQDHTFLDDSLVQNLNPHGNFLFNKEPLLVNTVNSHIMRPDSFTRIHNLFLAADYVKTHCDLACMDTADEAARRAVNAILSREEERADIRMKSYALPTLFGLFKTARIIDRWQYQKGLPWEAFGPTLWLFRSVIDLSIWLTGLPMLLMILMIVVLFLYITILIAVNFVLLILVSLFNAFKP